MTKATKAVQNAILDELTPATGFFDDVDEEMADKTSRLCARAAIATFLAHLDATGWKVVPKVPTRMMEIDARSAMARGANGWARPEDIYVAMIDAALKFDPEIM